MKRLRLLFLGILAITCFEFVYYPGHTYLAGESQNLVAMMERLRTPGFLSRDLVATNPNLTYTIYDETTLFLCRVTRTQRTPGIGYRRADQCRGCPSRLTARAD